MVQKLVGFKEFYSASIDFHYTYRNVSSSDRLALIVLACIYCDVLAVCERWSFFNDNQPNIFLTDVNRDLLLKPNSKLGVLWTLKRAGVVWGNELCNDKRECLAILKRAWYAETDQFIQTLLRSKEKLKCISSSFWKRTSRPIKKTATRAVFSPFLRRFRKKKAKITRNLNLN